MTVHTTLLKCSYSPLGGAADNMNPHQRVRIRNPGCLVHNAEKGPHTFFLVKSLPRWLPPFLAHRCSLRFLPIKSVRDIHNGMLRFVIVICFFMMWISAVCLLLAAPKVLSFCGVHWLTPLAPVVGKSCRATIPPQNDHRTITTTSLRKINITQHESMPEVFAK